MIPWPLGGLNENGPPKAHIFEYLVFNWWNSFFRIRGCGLGGAVPVGGRLWGFHSSHHLSCFLCIRLVNQTYTLSYCSSAMPACLPATHTAMTVTDWTLWDWKPQINSFFCNCFGRSILSQQYESNLDNWQAHYWLSPIPCNHLNSPGLQYSCCRCC